MNTNLLSRYHYTKRKDRHALKAKKFRLCVKEQAWQFGY